MLSMVSPTTAGLLETRAVALATVLASAFCRTGAEPLWMILMA